MYVYLLYVLSAVFFVEFLCKFAFGMILVMVINDWSYSAVCSSILNIQNKYQLYHRYFLWYVYIILHNKRKSTEHKARSS